MDIIKRKLENESELQIKASENGNKVWAVFSQSTIFI